MYLRGEVPLRAQQMYTGFTSITVTLLGKNLLFLTSTVVSFNDFVVKPDEPASGIVLALVT